MKLRRSRRGMWLGIGSTVGVLLVCGLAVGAYMYFGRAHTTVPTQTAVTEQQAAPTPRPVSVSANTLFFGNVYWGRYINDWSMASELKTAYPFSRLGEFQREKYDAWIAGLECPTVAGLALSSTQEDETLSFNCNPAYLSQAAQWFTAFTLANNHTDNQGVDGFSQTRQQLEKNGIQYFGHYDPDVTGDVCEVVALPVTVAYNDDSTQKQHLPVAFCGYHGVFKLPSQAALDEISKYAAVMPVIAMPHMGSEYTAAPDALKTEYYRAMIDRGADIVLGDHPHWIQTTEAYKGKLIVYSMGNFIFDQQDTAEVTRSAAINVVINTTSTTDQLSAWLRIGEACTAFQDTCLAAATNQRLDKLTFEYSFGAIGTNDSQKIVKPATEAQQASILERLKWANTMSQLQPPQKSL